MAHKSFAVVRLKNYGKLTITPAVFLKRKLCPEGVCFSMEIDNEIVEVDLLFEGGHLAAIEEMERLTKESEQFNVVAQQEENVETCPLALPIGSDNLEVNTEVVVTPLDESVNDLSNASFLILGDSETSQQKVVAYPQENANIETGPPTLPICEKDLDLYAEEVSSDSQLNLVDVSLPAGNDENSQQPPCSEQPSKKRRQQFCVICNKPVAKLFRHLVALHQNDDRIAKALSSDPKEKRRILDKIRREGYVKLSDSEVRERATSKNAVVPCNSCGVSFSKVTFYRHYQKCTGKKPPKNVVSNIMATKMLNKTPMVKTEMSQLLKDVVIPGMHLTPEMRAAITEDETVVRFGNSQCIRYRGEINKQKNLIRSRLRAVAAVRLESTSMDESIKTVMDLFHPSKFDTFVEAVTKFAKLDESSLQQQSPNNVLRVSLLFSNIAKDEKASCLPDDAGRASKERIACWIETYERKFRSTLGWFAEKVAARKKWTNRKLIPLAEDVMKFNTYLKNEIKASMESLKEGFELKAWERLNKATMTLLMAFNRKRVGEIMTITTDDYANKSKIREGTDIYNTLTEAEKINAKQFYHLIIRGKLARPVPLLISNDLAATIDVILLHRQEAGVTPENRALFAKGDGHFDANVATREAAYACGAQSPSDITSTALRKHIASITQAVNMSDGGLKTVCSFLGHTKDTHMENYRLPSDAINAARLSRLLVALDEGNISNFNKQSFEEIEANVEVCNEPSLTIESSVPGQSMHPESMVEPVPGPSQSPQPECVVDSAPGPSSNEPSSLPIARRRRRRRISSSGSDSSKDPTFETPEKSIPNSPIKTPNKTVKKRIYWKTPEKKAMMRHFSNNLKARTLPSLKECSIVRAKEPALRNRKEAVMKAWVSNQFKKNREM